MCCLLTDIERSFNTIFSSCGFVHNQCKQLQKSKLISAVPMRVAISTVLHAWTAEVFGMEADKCTFLSLRQRRTSTSDSIGPPTASDFNLRQHRTSDSVPPTASDHLRQRRTTISDSVGLLSPTASDFNLRQRRTTISDS